MYDRFDRKIDYLRISVTDRCNLRCTYCMPAEGIALVGHADILSFDEIRDFTAVAVRRGVSKVRITGGEPLVRKGIVTLTGMLASVKGISDLSMTTNGILLSTFAADLKKAGLMRVNISLDTIDPEAYRILTRGGDVQQVLEGISAARNAGLNPVKINCVLRHDGDRAEAEKVRDFCMSNGLEARFISQMDLAKGHFTSVEGGTGGNCRLCNRLRLTASGILKPCLFNGAGFNIRETGYDEAIGLALASKPECGTVNERDTFYNIGG